jgi:hypothetical protein
MSTFIEADRAADSLNREGGETGPEFTEGLARSLDSDNRGQFFDGRIDHFVSPPSCSALSVDEFLQQRREFSLNFNDLMGLAELGLRRTISLSRGSALWRPADRPAPRGLLGQTAYATR